MNWRRATDAYEGARQRVKHFINAPDVNEVILCAAPPRPSTSWPRAGARSTSARATRSSSAILEHHANIVPWQQLAAPRGRCA